jgi:hypothetical protein
MGITRQWHRHAVARSRLSTTVDAIGNSAYDAHPVDESVDEPDDWGDLASFRKGSGAADCA